MLVKVRDCIASRESISLSDLALHFNVQSSAMQGIVEVWIRKGKVKKFSRQPGCGSSCNQCSTDSTEMYSLVKV